MQDKTNHDAILLGFGHGFLGIAEQIVAAAKEMRKEIKTEHDIDFPRIHIIDHDYDSAMNNLPLKENEFIIKIYGVEKVRCQGDGVQVSDLIKELKRVILENLKEFDVE